MTQSFECPNCRASLDYDGDSQALTVRCDYCNSTVIVPEALRGAGRERRVVDEVAQAKQLAEVARLVQAGRKIEAIKLVRQTFDVGLKEAKEFVEKLERHEVIRLGGESIQLASFGTESAADTTISRVSGRTVGCIILAILTVTLLGVLIPLFGGGLAIFGIFSAERSDEVAEDLAGRIESLATADQPEPELTPTPGFASLVLRFGGQEGQGPGFFDDTRHIGVDGQGRIYTGDYSAGRIQVFDAEGNFLNLWHTGSDAIVLGLAVDRLGVVYLIERGVIHRYDGPTGEPLGQVAVSGRTNFRAVTTAADGSLVAFAEDRLVRFDREGNITLDVAEPVSQLADFRTTHESIAVDGAGNIFVLGSEAIYRFDANGNYVDRMGSRGEAEDQFETSPLSLAVDGQGRLYADDFDGIKVFEASGRYLDTIDFQGVAFAMVFNDQNELVVMDRNGNQVLKYVLNR